MKKGRVLTGFVLTSFIVGFSIFSYYHELQPKVGPIGDGPNADKLFRTLIMRIGLTLPLFILYLVQLIKLIWRKKDEQKGDI